MGKRNKVGRRTIEIRQFEGPNNLQGTHNVIAVVKRMVYRSTYVGPEKRLVASLPLSRRSYFWIEYLECRWPVERDKTGRYILRLPGQATER